MPVLNGQNVSEEVTNPAFLDAQIDDYAIGNIGFQNAASTSGFFITSIQRYINNLAKAIGATYTGNFTAEADGSINVYGSVSTTVPDTTTFKAAIKLLSDKFVGTLTGAQSHAHTGADGQGSKIDLSSLTSLRMGSIALANSVQTQVVTLSSAMATSTYVPQVTISNTVDAQPIFLQYYVSAQTMTTFTVTFNAPTDSVNYILNYQVGVPV